MASAVNSTAILRRQKTPLEPLIRRLESAEQLDGPGKALGKKVRKIIPSGPVKDTLSGTWLGHSAHPMLTDVVIGSFISATVLDFLMPRQDGASVRLIALGLLAYPPTAASGINDWADTEIADPAVRRAGLVHAGGNALAAGLYTVSLSARRRGSRATARLLSAAGATVLMGGGYIGGHLSFSRGVGPDQTVFDPGPTDWADAGDSGSVLPGQPTRVVVGDTPVLLLRRGDDRILAIHDRCSHRGCSLSDGTVEGDEIVCVCHGSRFDLHDGSVRGGPASAPQPAFATREREGRLEVRRLAFGQPS
jgi:nitrite reductase/ring-hydroxylating ferredoxin subunit/uncharacterized membrane protein